MITCGGCDRTWTGKSMAHCKSCHETFSTVSNFDKHRFRGRSLSVEFLGRCEPPDEIGMVQNNYGTWRKPDERDVAGLGALRYSRKGELEVALGEVPEPGPSGPESIS